MEETGTGPLSPRRLRRLLREYAELLRKEPENLVLRLKLAFVLRELGQLEEAIDMYRTVAVAYARDGRLVQAMAVCKGILEIDPNHHDTQELLAELAAQQGASQEKGMVRLQHMDGRWVAVPAPVVDPGALGEVDELAQTWDGSRGDELVQMARQGAEASRSEDTFAPFGQGGGGAPGGQPKPETAAGTDEPEPLPPPPGGFVTETSSFEIEPVSAELFSPEQTLSPVGGGEGGFSRPRWVALGEGPDHHDSLTSAAIRSQVLNEAETILARPSIQLRDEDILDVGPDEDTSFSPEERDLLNGLGTSLPERPSKNIVPVALLSALPRQAFMQFLSEVPVRKAAPGEMIIYEGEEGDAFYIIVGGRVRVLKTQENGEAVQVAELGPGSFFGEFALLADRKRHASVEAIEDVELFEVSRELLDRLVARYPEVGTTLWSFYRERLLQTLMATAPFFAPLSLEDRARVAASLRSRRYAAGAHIIEEGGRPGGLYLIVLGEVEVAKRREDGSVAVVGHLSEGSYFGEASLLRGGGASSVTVTATRPTEVVEVPPPVFYEIAGKYPELWDAMRREAARRDELTEAVLSGQTRQSGSTVYLL